MLESKYLIPLAVGTTALWGIIRKIKRSNLKSFAEAPFEKSMDLAVSGTVFGIGAILLTGWFPLAAPILAVTTTGASISHVVHQTGLLDS